jgi:gliding motility-associated-like protein
MNCAIKCPSVLHVQDRQIFRVASLIVCCVLLPLSHFGQTYFLNGTAASQGGDCYQLTTTLSNQNGAVWYGEFIDLTTPFELSFTMNFGMVFVLQDVGTDALGQSGGALGFNGFDPSFGVEFDTWNNGQYADLAQDHIGFVSDGSVNHAPPTGLGGPVQASLDNINIEDGEDHPVKITWDPSTQIIAVYFDCALRLAEQIDLIDTIFNGQSLVYWGFTGSTGGSYNNQSVCLSENIIATGPETVICPGASVELNVVGAPNSSYTWDPPTFLSNPEEATTWCTPDSSMVYTVTYEGFCDALITDSVFVFVEPLVASAEATPGYTLTCDAPQLDLSGTSNFPNGVSYNWESNGTGNIATSLGPNATVDAAGTYTLVVTSDDGVCTDETSLEITADFSTLDVSLTASDLQLDCNTATVEITATAEGGAALAWAVPAGAEWAWLNEPVVLETSTAGTWIVTSTNPTNGCEFETAMVIESDFTEPLVEAGWSDTITCASPAALIHNVLVTPASYTPLYEWSWNPAGSLNPVDPLNPIAYQPGMYYLLVTFEENGCSHSDSVLVFQDPEAFVDASSATLPNVISPNGDGLNERFRPFLAIDPEFPLLSIVDQYQLNIFNRWGNVLYKHDGGPVEWDGRLNGDLAAEGVYYVQMSYLILCGGEQRGTLQGELHLVR